MVVRYAGWQVDDGDPVIRVGEPWDVTIEVQRLGPSAADDWWPAVSAADKHEPVGLTEDPVVPAGYAFVADPVALGEDGLEWTALEVHGVRVAVPGRHVGRVRGVGAFVHDSYFVQSERVRDVVTQRRTVVAVSRQVGHRPAQALRSTHDVLPAEGGRGVSATYYIELEGGP